jgi:drug/metabolite transporter (DMT)-like permease
MVLSTDALHRNFFRRPPEFAPAGFLLSVMNPSTRSTNHLSTFAIVAASSILFCSKGVVAKLAYAQGVDALTVLTLRMAFALPFFIGMAIWWSRGADPLTARDWARLAGLGFLGYYISSFVNFTGLQYVSVGLERIVLYTYPSMVLAISAFVLRKPVRGATWAACAVAWLGIVIAFVGETHAPVGNDHTLWGAALIFTSAFTYAIFILMSGGVIRRVGAMRFTGIAVGFSCLCMLTHALVALPVQSFFALPAQVYGDGLVLALFGTVAPALLLGIGLGRTTPQQFAVIGTVGPVTTLFLAWGILGERPNLAQALGFILTLGGGLAVSLIREKARVPDEVNGGKNLEPVR